MPRIKKGPGRKAFVSSGLRFQAAAAEDDRFKLEKEETTMLCQNCQQRPATVHLTEIVNNQKREIHLCEECAQEKGVAIKAHVTGLDIPEFVGKLASSEQSAPGRKPTSELRCDVCGLTFEAFRNLGKFGCPNDYEVFKEGLVKLLERIHGSTQHRGKVPSRVTDRVSHQKELMQLKEELRVAVEREEYERAAELRDRIRRLEAELGVAGTSREEKGGKPGR